MKKFIAGLGFLMIACVACESGGGKTIDIQNMSQLASQILPSVKLTVATTGLRFARAPATAVGFTSEQETAMQGSEGFNIYRSFADPTLDPSYPNDSWGVDNIRNNLDIGNALSDYMAQSGTDSTTISTSVHGSPATLTAPARQTITAAVVSPYSFSNIPAGITYTTGLSAITQDFPIKIGAVWNTSDTFDTLAAFQCLDKAENTVFEGQYNDSTGAVRLNRASRVVESPGNYITHMELSGNASTKEFTVRMAKRTTDSEGFHFSMVGKGFASGEGQFFALKTRSCNSADCLAGATTYWYCVSAAAIAEDWIAFINDGTNYVQSEKITRAADHSGFSGDCATYATAMDDASLALFEDADLPDVEALYASSLGM